MPAAPALPDESGDHRQRFQQGVDRAEADVDQVPAPGHLATGPLVIPGPLAVPGHLDAQHQVGAGPDLPGAGADPHPPRVPGDAVAELLQHVGEQGVLLEAVPAARAGDELGLQIGEVQRGHGADHHVDVLERDAQHVRVLQ